MILTSLADQPAYRVHVPRWAIAPTSGAGSAQHGGRLNRIGVSALYLALDEQTALTEYRQLSTLMPPGLIVSYIVELASVVDFRQGYSADWDSLWQEMSCDWRRQWFNERVEPPSWLLGDLAMEAGASGILFPSMAHRGGVNLVVYTDALDAQDRLEAYDPDGRLPVDQTSWP
ncbi:RES domain-containing protein [Halomonas sp. McH1-25]|uniref:RES family NAD+ phosphorylase n=1 Tax=unclassified Halomonas TaxID=2609666 RepID=UPI001EF5C4F5|nr:MULTISPECIES: RES domain-containing protein [unclassified Halomonas]MCG7602126.1 RES domain-containing protein [Halomonas sp. McH1-25]MCP1344417.1 RES domain-containing protein [Halomonas sp. FL8]MCP1362493.1 RES domain-containing protein [Halomonas sp. BBD45]